MQKPWGGRRREPVCVTEQEEGETWRAETGYKGWDYIGAAEMPVRAVNTGTIRECIRCRPNDYMCAALWSVESVFTTNPRGLIARPRKQTKQPFLDGERGLLKVNVIMPILRHRTFPHAKYKLCTETEQR